MTVIGIICISVFILASVSLYLLMKSSDKFFREADRIENLIRDGADIKEVYPALFALDKKSFHKQMYSRLTELGKMAEIKYNVKIFKK